MSKVQTAELPDANDEFAQEASEFDTIEELRANIKERLTRMARLEQASQARDAVLESLLQQVDIEVPEQLLNAELETRQKQITEQLVQAGADARAVPRRHRRGSDRGRVLGRPQERGTTGPQGPDHLGQDRRRATQSVSTRTISPSTSCARRKPRAFRRSRSPITSRSTRTTSRSTCSRSGAARRWR